MQKQNELQNKDNSTQEVPYISESQEMISLRKYATDELTASGKQIGQINMAFDLLNAILFKMYKSTSFTTLLSRSHLITESNTFSKHAREITAEMKWANKTVLTAFSLVRAILRCTSIDANFINRISVTSQVIYPLSHHHHILPAAYKYLNDSSDEKLLLLKWVDLIKENTKNKSTISIKNMLYFFITIMNEVNLDTKNWNLESARQILCENLNSEFVKKMCGNINKKKLWLKIFYKHIVGIYISDNSLFARTTKKTITPESVFSDTNDVHKISVVELEAIYNEARKNLRNELIFLLLLTTGMRLGGLVNIKLEHVAEINDKGVEIKTCGRTIEKGNKWFAFVMNEKVRELMKEWITKGKHTSSEYLFPSRSGSFPYISRCSVRAIFKKLCTDAGLTGKHLHPHALRHTYAHMLLESGNSIDIISKLLGHSNSLTTESFYLRENATEVVSRANIPWLGKQKQEKKIPEFLIEQGENKPKKNTEQERRKRLKNLATISDFEIKPVKLNET